MEDLDKLRDKEMNRFQAEFDKKLNEFHELQSQLLEKIGVEQTKPAPKKTSKTKPVKKAAAKTKAKAVAKKSPEKKTSTKKVPASTKGANKLSDLNGVGPATVKKLNDAGITKLTQLAKPTQKEKKILVDFTKTKGFDTWQGQAEQLIKN